MKLGKLNLLSRQVLIAGSLIALAAGLATDHMQSRERQSNLEVRAETMLSQVSKRVAEYQAMLTGLQSMFNTFGVLPPETFRTYVNQLHLVERYPGLLRIEYLARRSEAATTSSLPNFQPPRAAFEGDAGRSFHLFSEHLELTSDNAAEVAGFGRVGTVTDGQSAPAAGLAYRLPIYRAGVPLQTAEQRQTAWLGTIGAWLDNKKLFAHLAQQTSADDLGLRITLAQPGKTSDANQHRAVFDSLPDNNTEAISVRSLKQSFLGGELDISVLHQPRWRWRDHLLGGLVTLCLLLASLGLHIALRLRYERRMDEHERILQSAAARAELAASAGFLAHELNNALQIMSNSLGVLRLKRAQQALTPADIDEEIEPLDECLQRATRTVTQIDGMAKANPVLSPQTLGVLEMFEHARRHAQRSLGCAAEEIVLHVEPPSLTIFADEAALQNVLRNLIRNAHQAIHEAGIAPGRITLSAVAEGRNVRLSVADNGRGLPANLPLFKAFCTTKADGTGLGLLYCRNTLQQMGGRIEAHNRAGGGAEIILVLPMPE